jgi:hypothetical protein
MKNTMLDDELWIGLAKVEQSTRNGTLGEADGAYTNAIAKASSRLNFRRKVRDSLKQLELKLIRLENPQTLNERLAKYSIDPELVKVAEEADLTGNVGFGTFHAFDAGT